MDALAEWQIKKKNRAQAKAAKDEESFIQRGRTREDDLRVNKIFGFPDPPSRAFALGKDGCAAVWWVYDDMEGIIGWEVLRYRKDGNQWQCKGSMAFDTVLPLQVIIPDLNNGHEYKFAVKAVNAKGPGMECELSNGVYVDSPLPPGWYRFYDRRAQRYYFASVKTNRSSWTRPDIDPDFLGDDIYSRFNKKELDVLRKLFDEDIEHFGCIKADQVSEIIREIGEKQPPKKIAQLFNMISGDPTKLETWQHFMQLMVALKEQRNRSTVRISPWRSIVMFFTRQKIKADLKSSRNKLGVWIIEYNAMLQKHFYRNTITGATTWLIPEEVKFYLPKKLEQRLLQIFDYGQLEDFRNYFDILDLDNSGDLSHKEISLLLDAMGIKISDQVLTHLIKTIDTNGNGTVEYDEFCWMMYELGRKDQSIAKKQEKRYGGLASMFRGTGGSDLLGDTVESGGVTTVNSKLTFSKLMVAVRDMRTKDGEAPPSGLVVPFRRSLSFRSTDEEPPPGSPPNGGSPLQRRGSFLSAIPFSGSPQKVHDESSVISSVSSSSKPKMVKTRSKADLYKPKPKRENSRRKGVVISPSGGGRAPPPQEEEDDSDDDEEDDPSEYQFLKQRSGSFFGLTRSGSSRLSETGDAHPKDCMCGCRRF